MRSQVEREPWLTTKETHGENKRRNTKKEEDEAEIGEVVKKNCNAAINAVGHSLKTMR